MGVVGKLGQIPAPGRAGYTYSALPVLWSAITDIAINIMLVQVIVRRLTDQPLATMFHGGEEISPQYSAEAEQVDTGQSHLRLGQTEPDRSWLY